MSEGKEIISVSKHTMKRLPVYLSYLKSMMELLRTYRRLLLPGH